MTPKTKRKETG